MDYNYQTNNYQQPKKKGGLTVVLIVLILCMMCCCGVGTIVTVGVVLSGATDERSLDSFEELGNIIGTIDGVNVTTTDSSILASSTNDLLSLSGYSYSNEEALNKVETTLLAYDYDGANFKSSINGTNFKKAEWSENDIYYYVIGVDDKYLEIICDNKETFDKLVDCIEAYTKGE